MIIISYFMYSFDRLCLYECIGQGLSKSLILEYWWFELLPMRINFRLPKKIATTVIGCLNYAPKCKKKYQRWPYFDLYLHSHPATLSLSIFTRKQKTKDEEKRKKISLSFVNVWCCIIWYYVALSFFFRVTNHKFKTHQLKKMHQVGKAVGAFLINIRYFFHQVNSNKFNSDCVQCNWIAFVVDLVRFFFCCCLKKKSEERRKEKI